MNVFSQFIFLFINNPVTNLIISNNLMKIQLHNLLLELIECLTEHLIAESCIGIDFHQLQR